MLVGVFLRLNMNTARINLCIAGSVVINLHQTSLLLRRNAPRTALSPIGSTIIADRM